MRKIALIILLCFLVCLVSCKDTAENNDGILPDGPTYDPLKPTLPDQQEQNGEESDKQKPTPDGEENGDSTSEPPENITPPTEDDGIDVYTLQNDFGEEVLTLDFYEGTYVLKVDTTHSGSYTAEGNHVTLDFFDEQNTWTLQSDGSMTQGHRGEALDEMTGVFNGKSAYGEYTLTLLDDGTYTLTQNETSRGSYLIVDGYTILKRDRYDEENLYLITDRETESFYYAE